MKVVIETPKYSFVKYARKNGKYVKAMTSPFPTLFNYGFIKGKAGKDGMPKDCIVLGGRLEQGVEIEFEMRGEVKFIDDGREDDKTIFSLKEKIIASDKLRIRIFFTIYALYKKARYLLKEQRTARCRYNGFCLL